MDLTTLTFTGVGCQEQIAYGGHTNPKDILWIGSKYPVAQIIVKSWTTEIYLVNIPGHCNALWFECQKPITQGKDE